MRNLLFCLFISLITITFQAHAAEFALTTTGFLDQGALPVLYTCDGKDISPAFDWTDAPAKAQAFAFTVTDPEAPGGTFYHWIVYNLPKGTTQLPEGVDKLPAGTLVGKNDFGNTKYNGPCPPKGTAHTYVFTLYALDNKLSVQASASGKTVEEAMKNHIVAKVSLSAVYSRWLTYHNKK